MADWESALAEAEQDLTAEVTAVLDEVAAEFAAGLETATEIVAARFRVSSIARMFTDRLPRLLRRLFRIAQTAAEDAASSVGEELPDGWDDLPGRYDDGTLPRSLGDYAETTEHLLRAVGDRLAETAVRALAEGLDAGEDIDQLRARLRAAFDEEGAQLGETRAERIAHTEATRAWNTATLAAAQDLTSPDRPLVKQWRCVAPDTPVVASGVTAAARRHYTGSLLRLRTASGRSVTLTPEHPVLTGRGWLQAQSVNKSDHLFQVTGIDPVGAPGVEHLPTGIGEFVDAAMAARAVEVRTVPGRVDLDGHMGHGDIEVVPADRHLTAHFEPGRGQGPVDLFLTPADVLGQAALLAGGDSLDGGAGERDSTQGIGCLGDPLVPGFRGLGGSPDETRSTFVPQGDTGLAQDADDGGPGAAVSSGDRSRARAPLVRCDDGLNRQVVTAARGYAEHLRCTGLAEARGVPLKQEPSSLTAGADCHPGLSQTTLDGRPRRPHLGSDLSQTFPGLVAAGHLVDVEHTGVGLGVAPVVDQDRFDALTAQAAGFGDRADQLATVEASQDVRNNILPRGGRLPGHACAAQFHASLNEASSDRAVTDPELGAQLACGGTGFVTPDKVVDIEVTAWSGYVYDLSTTAGWFAADGIVVHNSNLDARTRDAHRAAHAQIQLLDEPFQVGGVPMRFPGDPAAPPHLVIRCRCVLRLQRADRTAATLALGNPSARPGAANESNPALRPHVYESKEPSMLDLRTPGGPERAGVDTALKLAQTARRLIERNRFPYGAEASHPETVTAATTEYTGGMVALIPTHQDAQRLALEDGEDAAQLHCTLWYLGSDVSDWTETQRAEFIAGIRARAASLPGPVRAKAFGVNHWNPQGDDPVWVWSVGDDPDAGGDGSTSLQEARWAVIEALEDTHDRPDTPRQHSPWAAHTTAVYTADTWPLEAMAERLGPITFDRVRVAFAGDYTDIPLGPEEEPPMEEQTAAIPAAPPTRAWSTPGDTALAFENQQTGDGRIFKPGALHWETGPWPLQYADEMLMGHEGAELAGAIQSLSRDGDRIPGTGVLYLTQRAGSEAVELLEQGAPLGVSVDLDDVDIEVVDNTAPAGDEEGEGVILAASVPSLSALRLEDGSWVLSATTMTGLAASGTSLVRSRHTGQLITGPGGEVTPTAVRHALDAARVTFTSPLTAAAGDPDKPESGTVVHAEESGAYLLRITRARVRGATLVAMPAFADARIVLDPVDDGEGQHATAVTAAGPSEDHHRVIRYVCSSPVPVGAREVAEALDLSVECARGHLRRAVEAGRLVRLAPGLYVGPSDIPEGDLSAAASGDLDLPVHDDRGAEWDGDKAASRVLAWATEEDGNVDPDKLARAFLYREEDGNPATLTAYKLPFADVFDSADGPRLEIVARGVFAVAGALQGAMGGVDVPDDERDALRGRVERLYARLAEAFDDPAIRPPWDTEDELTASAWTAMRDLPPMPAEWFREPTEEELPPGSGGVHYKGGRVYGWVAQAGEPHAGYPGQNLTIERIAKQGLDLTHFLRARFRLDDGSTVRAGAFTMNVGHHRDGAECETDACQFDDTRTVAGIITVGMNKRGLWFSGAAAPWLSDWDRVVFQSCQPSYHLKQGPGGRWQLRAVLSVPVPGHSSPLLAAAVVERANLTLAASAALADAAPAGVDAPSAPAEASSVTADGTVSGQPGRPADAPSTPAGAPSADVLAEALAAALARPDILDQLAAAVRRHEDDQAAHRAEIERLAAELHTTEPAAVVAAGDATKGDI